MPKKYTKEDTISALKEFLTEGKICNLYDEDFLNWTGIVKDGKEKYADVIAKHLLLTENLNFLKGIPSVCRKESYNCRHEQIDYDPSEKISNEREEERRARSMKNKTYKGIGKIIDYQTPLKDVLDDGTGRNIGKIDLLSYDKEKGRVYIIEYKKPDSSETLLRCCLEVYTYWRTVQHKRLLSDFGLPSEAELRKAVLVYQGSNPVKGFDSGSFVASLMKELEIDLFILADSKNDDEDVVSGRFFNGEAADYNPLS